MKHHFIMFLNDYFCALCGDTEGARLAYLIQETPTVVEVAIYCTACNEWLKIVIPSTEFYELINFARDDNA